jgi:hypothetical protein
VVAPAILGEGNCLLGFGDVARARSDRDGARDFYEQALGLYRKIGARNNEALCLRRLASLGD